MANKKRKPASRPPAKPAARAAGPAGQAGATGPSREKKDRGPSQAQLQRERAAAARRRAERRRWLTTAAALGVVLVVIGGLLYYRQVKAERFEAALAEGSCTTDRKTDPTSANPHVQSPTYTVDPPAGGNHLGSAAPAGVYTPGEAPDGQLVHSLEHGYIIFWHKPDLPADQRAALTRLYEEHKRDVLLVERPTLPVPVAATAWGHRMLCQRPADKAFRTFVDDHVNEGPERIEHPEV